MKGIKLFIILGVAGLAQAATQTMWVEGVSATSGWYDANKAKARGDGDDLLCWAATATNMITWWQGRYSLPEDIPNTQEAIWSTFKDSVNADQGGDMHAAIQWWVSGVYVPLNAEERRRSLFGVNTYSTLDSFEGYYWGRYDVGLYDLDSFLEMGIRNDSMSNTSGIEEDLLDVVSRGCGVGLTVTSDVIELGHAITLWGIEYDDVTREISKLWLTDSDDEQYGLNEGGLFSVDVTTDGKKLYIQDKGLYTADREVYVNGIMAINPNKSDTWGMPFAMMAMAIPEPTTATLSLLALAGLAARRRRK